MWRLSHRMAPLLPTLSSSASSPIPVILIPSPNSRFTLPISEEVLLLLLVEELERGARVSTRAAAANF